MRARRSKDPSVALRDTEPPRISIDTLNAAAAQSIVTLHLIPPFLLSDSPMPPSPSRPMRYPFSTSISPSSSPMFWNNFFFNVKCIYGMSSACLCTWSFHFAFFHDASAKRCFDAMIVHRNVSVPSYDSNDLITISHIFFVELGSTVHLS